MTGVMMSVTHSFHRSLPPGAGVGRRAKCAVLKAQRAAVVHLATGEARSPLVTTSIQHQLQQGR
eukprot:scaffold83119_cov31-Tisochrysis_lutea.AAC.6